MIKCCENEKRPQFLGPKVAAAVAVGLALALAAAVAEIARKTATAKSFWLKSLI